MAKRILKATAFTILGVFISSTVLAKPLSEYYQKIEDELIKKSDQLDKLVDERGAFYSDKNIERYVSEVGLRLIPSNFNNPNINIKFKVIKDPTLNAMALPNGTIWIHAGLLARLNSEAQLAFILGHELSHIVNKDGLYIYESATTNIMFAKILDIGLSAASAFIGLYADLGQLGLAFLTQAAISGYGREKETRADVEGITFMVNAGYAPDAAIETFNEFIKEKEKYDDRIEIYFLSNHPSNQFRRKMLDELISKQFNNLKDKKTESMLYENTVYSLKKDDVSVNVRINRLQHAIDAIELLIKDNSSDPVNYYLLGECYRLMAEDRTPLKYELKQKDWQKIKDVKELEYKTEYCGRAEKQYLHALELKEDFADSYKGLGLLRASEGKTEDALSYLEKYLLLNPSAWDRRFIKAAINRLKEKNQEAVDAKKS
jgi:hypothetical protein